MRNVHVNKYASPPPFHYLEHHTNKTGYSAAGEVLNCDAYTVACRAAIDLEADKLLCMTLPATCPLTLPQWLPLSDAERMLLRLAAPPHLSSLDSALESLNGGVDDAPFYQMGRSNGQVQGSRNGGGGGDALGGVRVGLDGEEASRGGNGMAPSSDAASSSSSSSPSSPGRRRKSSSEVAEELYDFAKWASYGVPPALMAAVVACRNGVKRAHLV